MEAYFPKAPFAHKKIHLGVSGSVAAYKSVELLRAFYKSDLRVTVTLTAAATRFISALSFRSLGAEAVYTAMFESGAAEQDDPFTHLTPGAESDAFLIAPASANSIARLAAGLADEILSAQALAWSGRLLLAPAMNPRMWNNRATQENCAALTARGHIIITPESGLVACGEEGNGRFADLRIIYLHTLRALSTQDLAGKKVMLTLGPTREPWDGVRFWSNRSTGLMGASIAVAAWLRGAEVHALCGPSSPWLPPQIYRYDTGTALEMFEQANSLWAKMDIGVFAAAVADFSPEPFGGKKFKKADSAGYLNVKFSINPDILATLGGKKSTGQRIIGFAAETDDIERNASAKLVAKNADLLVANRVGVPDSGFAGIDNTVFMLDKTGRAEHLPTLPKADLAWRILDWLSTL